MITPLPLDEVMARLALDDEGLVASEDAPLVVVDVSAGCDASFTPASAPAVFVAFDAYGTRGTGGPAVQGFDVVTSSWDDVEAIAATVAAAPRAAVAAALLLRFREGRTLDAALVAESTTYSMLQGGPEFRRWLEGPDRERFLRRRPGAGPAEVPAVLVDRDGDVLTVRLNRPDRHNAFSVAIRDGLVEALRVAVADPDVRVVLTGNGPSFSSGGDLAEFGSFPDPASSHLLRLTRSAARLLVVLGSRVEARVHGACLGAGAELSAFCGRVVASPDAYFGLPEVPLGLVPGAGGTASLPTRIGRQRTALMALTGRPIDATTALAWGLVDGITDTA